MHYPATRITLTQASILASRLQRRARALRDEIGTSLHSGSLEIPPDQRATADIEASVTSAGLERDAVELAEIEAALDRVKVGAYGLCTECGEPLPLARLGALPQARRCMDCESTRGSARPPSL